MASKTCRYVFILAVKLKCSMKLVYSAIIFSGLDLESMDGYSMGGKENITIKEYSEMDDSNAATSASQAQVNSGKEKENCF